MGGKGRRRGKQKRGRRPIKEITEPQRRTLSTILRLTNLRGHPPTVREVAEELRITHASVYGQINQLIRKGFLRRRPHKARSLEVVATPKDDPMALFPVKIVGDVAAGLPSLEAQEDDLGEILVEAHVLGGGECFALRAKGDSMTGAGINDGDYCIVRKQPVAESGEIIAAIKGNEGVVKRLHFSGDRIELRSENPKYEPIPIRPEDDFRIAGKVVAVRRAAARSGNSR